MKTAHLVVGISLVTLGVLLAVGSTFLTGSRCTDDPPIARPPGVPLCSHVFTQIIAVAGAGLILLIFGVLVLASGQEKNSGFVSKFGDYASPRRGPVVVPYRPVPQQVAHVPRKKVCPTCGTVYGPEAQFCEKDATPLQVPSD